MQVRSVEFQEHFGRVPVETSRQQSVLQRDPELARQHTVQATAQEHVLDLSRPTPATETESPIVDPDNQRTPERRTGTQARERRSGQEQARERRPAADGISGTQIDIVV